MHNRCISSLYRQKRQQHGHRPILRMGDNGASTICGFVTSARKISIRAERLRQSGHAPSEPSQTPRWQTTPRPVAIRRVALPIALQSRLRRFFSLCRYPIVNEHHGVVANCDHTSEWVHWIHQQNVNRSGSLTQGSISTRHFVCHICLRYSHNISKMYFSLLKTPEVSERMWSVNLDASISEDYQTVGGHSGRPSE